MAKIGGIKVSIPILYVLPQVPCSMKLREKREEGRREPNEIGEKDTTVLGLAWGRILVIIFTQPTSSNYLTT